MIPPVLMEVAFTVPQLSGLAGYGQFAKMNDGSVFLCLFPTIEASHADSRCSSHVSDSVLGR